MLDTLYRFGEYLSQNSDRQEFDDIIVAPPIDEKDQKLNTEFLIAGIVFDLDAARISFEDPKRYDAGDSSGPWSAYTLRNIKIQGGNNKSIYLTVDPRKSFDAWKKTFFGKPASNGSWTGKGELTEAIEKDFPQLKDTLLFKICDDIAALSALFTDTLADWKITLGHMGWGEKSKVALLYAAVKSEKHGINTPTIIAQLDGYDTLLRLKFLKATATSDEISQKKDARLCYVTGQMEADVDEPSFSDRYSPNKMFVTTTKNYAPGFDDKLFARSYQISATAGTYLERGASYFLKNFITRIAGINHCIIPRFWKGEALDLYDQTTRLGKKSEWLFQLQKRTVENLLTEFEDLANDAPYWISFIGFESDGNFFKTINLIEDVSRTHFEHVFGAFSEVDEAMEQAAGQQWIESMTSGKEKERCSYNFYTLFHLFPMREDGGKKNQALLVCKDILEGRRIDRSLIWEHFRNLVLIHRFEKPGYNVKPAKDYFDFSIRNAVFQYHAFLLFLKKLNLIDMQNSNDVSGTNFKEKQESINTFFEHMGYNDDQKALFYLGQVLSSVGREQKSKGHSSKPVLNKLNYNGMDAVAIQRLYVDLFEKCKQYEVLHFNEGSFSKFTALFVEKDWNKRNSPLQSLFYLLAGYSFWPFGDKNEGTLSSETEN